MHPPARRWPSNLMTVAASQGSARSLLNWWQKSAIAITTCPRSKLSKTTWYNSLGLMDCSAPPPPSPIHRPSSSSTIRIIIAAAVITIAIITITNHHIAIAIIISRSCLLQPANCPLLAHVCALHPASCLPHTHCQLQANYMSCQQGFRVNRLLTTRCRPGFPVANTPKPRYLGLGTVVVNRRLTQCVC